MLHSIILTAAAFLLALLLFFEKRQHRRALLSAKTLLSCMFIFAALIQPHLQPGYVYPLLAGLIFCLGGDVFLAFAQQRMFQLGLISFLLGHVLYIMAFFNVSRTSEWTWFGVVTCGVAGAIVYRWLYPHLGNMKISVLIYVVVISAMVVGAVSLAAMNSFSTTGRILVGGGSVCFYISDIFVARDRFLSSRFHNRLLGLPLYYAGQFMLAFSVGFIR